MKLKNLLNKNFEFDTLILTSGKNITFIAASIISALINLFFIGNLSQEKYGIGAIFIPTTVFLCAMAITLELSKLLHITMYNTLKELSRKLKGFDGTDKIDKVANKWFAGYILYAILAVTSATFFSFNAMGVKQQTTDDSVNYITQDYKEAETLNSQIETINKTINSLNANKNNTSAIDEEYNKIIFPMLEKARISEQNNWTIIDENGKTIKDPFENEWEIWYKGQILNLGLKSIGITNGRTLREKLDVITYRSIKQQSVDSEINNNNILLESKKNDLNSIFVNNDVSSFRELEKKYRTITNGQYSDGGTSAVFKLVGNIIGISDGIIRGALLLFLSLLIEITIYQTSPKVKISSTMLYQFTQYLPADFKVKKFMEKVDKELVDYGVLRIAKKDEVELNKKEIELEKAKKEAETAELTKKTEIAKEAVKKSRNKKQENIEKPIENTLEVKEPEVKEVENTLKKAEKKAELADSKKVENALKETAKKNNTDKQEKIIRVAPAESEIKEILKNLNKTTPVVKKYNA